MKTDIRAFFNQQNVSSYGATATNQKQNKEVKNAVVATMNKIIADENGRDSGSDTEEDRKMSGDKEINAIPQNYEQALAHSFESDVEEVVMLSVRTSPKTEQDIIAVAAGTCALFEMYCNLHPQMLSV